MRADRAAPYGPTRWRAACRSHSASRSASLRDRWRPVRRSESYVDCSVHGIDKERTSAGIRPDRILRLRPRVCRGREPKARHIFRQRIDRCTRPTTAVVHCRSRKTDTPRPIRDISHGPSPSPACKPAPRCGGAVRRHFRKALASPPSSIALIAATVPFREDYAMPIPAVSSRVGRAAASSDAAPSKRPS
jgi:hypothetical protein